MGILRARRNRGLAGRGRGSLAPWLRDSMRRLLLGASAIVALTAAAASETISYSYDARGRLVKVAHSGTVNNGASACYAYDKGDNRSNVTVATGSDCAAVTFSISSNGPVTEGANSVFTVSKSGTATVSLTVNYATANGTAVAPGDYTAKSGTLTFTTAQTSQTVSVATVDDTLVENPETFTMSLSAPTGGATIDTGTATATINDNDTVANQPPVANFDNAGSMTCGDVMTYNVVANDTDPDGNLPLSLVSASGSAGIAVSVATSTDIQILSTGASSGTKSFSYVVQDSLGAQATGSGSVNVLAPCQ